MEIPTLEINSRGIWVYMLQAALNYRNFGVPLTGVFNMDTFNAVKAFRREFYLTGDTVVDLEFWKKLLNY